MIKEIGYKEFEKLYRKHIRRDFALSERRPLGVIRRLYKRGCYACHVLVEEGKMAAYACFVRAPNVDCVLLDYYAVLPEGRGGGVGSRFLQALRTRFDIGGILIESELPRATKSEENRATRQRRVAFYEHNGADETGYGWWAFGVHYILLWLPVNKSAQMDAAADIKALYAGTMPRFVLAVATRLYRL